MSLEDFESKSRDYKRVAADLDESKAAYAQLLAAAYKVNPQLAKLAAGITQNTALLSELETDMVTMARESKLSLEANGIKVEFSDPTTKVVDAEALLREFPQAAAIPGLIKREVDKKVLEIAVAAGRIPEHVVARHTEIRRTTSAGRVQFKLLK